MKSFNRDSITSGKTISPPELKALSLLPRKFKYKELLIRLISPKSPVCHHPFLFLKFSVFKESIISIPILADFISINPSALILIFVSGSISPTFF